MTTPNGRDTERFVVPGLVKLLTQRRSSQPVATAAGTWSKRPGYGQPLAHREGSGRSGSVWPQTHLQGGQGGAAAGREGRRSSGTSIPRLSGLTIG